MLTNGQFPFMYGQVMWMACCELEFRYLTRTGWEVLPDGYSIGQNRKCDRQVIEIHNRMVSRRAEPRSGYRVVEGQ